MRTAGLADVLAYFRANYYVMLGFLAERAAASVQCQTADEVYVAFYSQSHVPVPVYPVALITALSLAHRKCM